MKPKELEADGPMSRNPYAPPTASVADPPPVVIPRPRQVTLAVRLQWFSLVVGFATAMPRQPWDDAMMLGFALIFIGIYSAIVAWLIFEIARGRNWARIVYTVLALLSYVSMFTSWRMYTAAYHGHPELLVLDIIDTLADIGGLYFMFTRAANAWFRPRAAAS
jgi:hypothetical protein